MTEHEHQCALIRWARLAAKAKPDLAMLYAIPNGGHRNVVVAAKLKSEGVVAGVPDLCLAVPKNGFNGLYIELKKPGGRLTPEQKNWLALLIGQGYQARCCHGWVEAKQAIEDYLGGVER